MSWTGFAFEPVAVLVIPALLCGCNNSYNPGQQDSGGQAANMQDPEEKIIKTDAPNELGYAKISIRDGGDYKEGIVDEEGKEIVQPSADILVNDITGSLALLQLERKFVFVPLDKGAIAAEAFDQLAGFHYAEPYQCGFARVIDNNVEFYIDRDGQKAFGLEFEFAESFHHDRALVKKDDRFRIIDTQGKTVADLDYEQVNPQSPWCWQVTRIEQKKYLSGFVDLQGKEITELVYENIGYYDPEVKRIRVSRDDRYGFLDEFAQIAIPVQYEEAEPFNRGKARVVLGGRSFFINPDGIEVPE